jgi:DNA transformation protein
VVENATKAAAEKLTDLPNISTVLSGVLIDAGIKTPEELRELGSKEAFIRIRMRDNTACLCKLCAIEGAIRGVRWHNLDDSVKNDLRGFFKGL